MSTPAAASQLPFERLRPELLRIAYADPAELQEARHQAFMAAMQATAREHPAVYALVVAGPAIRVVDPAFGMFWSRLIGTLSGRFKAGAVVTSALGVRATAQGVALSLRLTHSPFELKTFTDEPSARTWLEGIITSGVAR